MENEVFRSLASVLAEHLGAPTMHESETGVRFKSAAKGKATVYHTGVAAGNDAEVAFDVESMALRLRMSDDEFRKFAANLRTSTSDLAPGIRTP